MIIKEQIDGISNKYLVKEIFSYLQLNKFLKIIKKSKKYQKVMNISLLTYQSIFLFNKLKIDFKEINVDKLFPFITDEFKIKVDKNLFNKMIEEKKAKEAIIPINNILLNTNQELKLTNIDKNINWISDINIIKLELSEIISNLEEQITIPSGKFPNLKILKVTNNFIIPTSIIIPLIELYISCINNDKKIIFRNDTNRSEINLNNLELLDIFTYNRKKPLNIINEIFPKQNNNFIFHIKKLKHLRLDLSSNYDNTFIEKYFDLNLSEIIETRSLNKNRTTFIDLINKKEKYFKSMSMNDLININISYSSQYKFPTHYKKIFVMETTKSGLRKYSYTENRLNEDARIFKKICLEEKYEQKEDGNKILKSYTNCFDYNNINLNLTNINNINAIIINGRGRKINTNEVNAIFDIKKDNYSLQEISLSFDGNGIFVENYYKTLMKNISKFKVLKKLFIYDNISYDNFKIFLDNITKLKLLEEIYLKVDPKNNILELKNSIKKKFPLCVVDSFDKCFLRVRQNIENKLEYNKNNYNRGLLK